MIGNLALNRVIWLVTALLSLTAALCGILNPGLYARLVTPAMIPGTISQDLVTVPVALVLLFWAVRMKEDQPRRQVVALGLLSYLWYGYGIWVIERMYNSLYLLYLAIFALSFWALVYGLGNLRPEELRKVTLPKAMRGVSVAWSLMNPLIFIPLWTSQLLPLMAAKRTVDHYYSVYILDLAFVMPALLILAVLSIKHKGLGLFLTPALFVKGFTLLFSVGLGGLIAPLYGQSGDPGQTGFYLALAAVFAVMSALHLRYLGVATGRKAQRQPDSESNAAL